MSRRLSAVRRISSSSAEPLRGGYFALETESELVVYNYFFDLEEASKDVEEFVHALEKILQLCDIWAKRIDAKLSESATGGECEGQAGDFFQNNHIVP